MKEVRIGLVGAGRMGSFHGRTVARKIYGAKLNAIADPVSGAAERLAKERSTKGIYRSKGNVPRSTY